MPEDPPSDPTPYRVVVNPEEQYSLWRADEAPPAGWRPEGTEGDRAACLARIREIWTDPRPLSLRRPPGAAPRA